MGTVRYNFADETVVVTGGSSGIGRAIALTFGEAGATVVNADIRSEPKDVDAELPTHERIASDGGSAAYVETDVSKPASLENAIDEAREYGGVDVMVNNAGWFTRGPLESVSEDEFDRIHDVIRVASSSGAKSRPRICANATSRGVSSTRRRSVRPTRRPSRCPTTRRRGLSR